MNKYLIYFVFLLFSSCAKKDDPIPVIEAPVFKMIGTVNGQAINIQAGVDDYIMYTDFIYENSASAFDFNGTLRKYSCASCPNSLKIKIRNHTTSSSSQSVFADSAFTINYYSIRTVGANSTQYDINFNSQLGGGIPQVYTWDFGDGTTSSLSNPQHTYQHPGAYEVKFKVEYQGGCLDSLMNTFRMGVPGADCRAIFLPTIAANTVTMLNNSTGAGLLTYNWNFGDGSSSSLENPQHSYVNNGIYTICLQVSDVDNNVSNFCRKVIILPQITCMTSYNYPQSMAINNPSALSNVTIEWTDENGVLFSSINNTLQREKDYFKILSVEEYAENSNGDKTKKLEVRFQCRLYDSGQTSFVDLVVNDAVIGVAYK